MECNRSDRVLKSRLSHHSKSILMFCDLISISIFHFGDFEADDDDDGDADVVVVWRRNLSPFKR